ncbi:acyltransferase-domain-containing protein [Zychaea mexicana]|uniref:acyltransferase-domain-containing protein n=1 Tax=Zychaea mexicana TaxID=64656 RepID=UPI0022FE2733|nr:acyltransferase-domain-containing protein [Zychaea mexicana]KAI9484912.1 acyltransferase-domain-containing protein [Zychaea mexicana]
MATAALWTPRATAKLVFTNSAVFIHTCANLFCQFLAFLLLPFSAAAFHDSLAYILRLWVHLVAGLIQCFAPSDFVLTVDSSCDERMVQRNKQGDATGITFPKRILVTSNHQIYADWLYIWLVAFAANAHGSMKIILKHSLKYLPVFGLSMTIVDFIFLKRKLAVDKETIVNNLERSKRHKIPTWLLLFPEGTVISESTRERSKAFAKKNDMNDNRFTLLPRSTGLKLILETLGDDPEWMYDFTIGYQGVKATDIPEKVYTIRSIFSLGVFPKKIHVYIRRFRIPDLPLHDEKAFANWLFDRWAEKDEMLAHYYDKGQFPDGRDRLQLPIRLKNPIRDIGMMYVLLLPYIPFCLLAYKLYNMLFCSAS